MSMLSRHRTFLRCIALFTAMTFLPSSVQAWYFLPQVQGVVLAAEDGPIPLSPEKVAELEAGNGNTPAPLSDDKRAQLAERAAVPVEAAAVAAKPEPVPVDGSLVPIRVEPLDEAALSRLVSKGTAPTPNDETPEQVAQAGTEESLEGEGTGNLPPVPRRRTAWAPDGVPQVVQAHFTPATMAPLYQAVLAGDPVLEAVPTTVPEPPQGLSAALAEAQSAWQEGQGYDAFVATVQLAETYPNIQWEDVMTARALGEEIAREVDAATQAAIEAAIPGLLSSLTTAYGKERAAEYYAVRAQELGGPEVQVARPHLEKLRDAHWQIVQQHPNELIGHFKIRTYLKACEDLGELAEGEVQLWEFLQNAAPSLVAFSSWNYFAEKAIGAGDFREARACYANVLHLANQGVLAPILQSSTASPESKAARLYILGLALEFTGLEDEALAQYQYVAGNFTDPPDRIGKEKDVPALLAGIRAARLIAKRNESDPYQGIVAYDDYIQANPAAALAGKAALEMAGLYLRAGDYQQSANYFGQVMQNYPGSDAARIAEHELDFVLENLYDSMEVAFGVGAPEPVMLVAQNCGPHALRRLLAARGIDVSVEELSELAETNDTGTSMLGLVKAAGAKGLPMAGVVASAPDDLAAPFIAFVRDEHFLLVTAVNEGNVTIADLDRPEEVLSRAEFTAMWRGEALVVAEGDGAGAEPIDLARLQGTRGGTGDPPAGTGGVGFGHLLPLGYDPTPFQALQPALVERQLGSWGQALNGESFVSPIPENPNPGNFRGDLSDSGVYVPGGYLAVNPVRTGVMLRARDMGFTVRGDLQLVYSRTYSCLGGFPNPETTDVAAPWSNIAGAGWTHSFNMHLRMPDAGGGGYPATVDYYDERGIAFEFAYASSGGGEDLFTLQTAVPAQGKRLTLARNQSTGEYTLWFDNGSRHTFSVPADIGANDNFARLNSILDRHDNALTMAYDGAAGTGKLTKVSAPSGDPRLLELAYSGNFITKAALKSGGTELLSYTYAYDANDDLTTVTDNASNDVTYAYDTYGAATGSRFMEELTDKAGTATTLAWTFGLNYYSDYEAYKIVLTNADNLATTYERSLTTYLTTITNKITTATKSKAVYTPVRSTFQPQSVDYYLNNLTQYERWNYNYGSDGYSLTKVVGPGTAVLAQFTYDANKRFSTATSRSNTTRKYEYASSGAWAPTKIYRQDGTLANVAYDGNGDITHASGTETAAGTTYEYDGYGQVTSATDAFGNETTYAYDLRGNVTSSTSPLSQTSTQEYDLPGNRTKFTDPHSRISTFEYDSGTCGGCGGTTGALTKTTDPDGNVTENEYDVHGNLTRRILPTLDEYTYAHDAMGRVTSSTSPRYGSSATTYTYDVLGRISTTTEPDSGSTVETLDHMGRVIASGGVGGQVQYAYDSHGNRLTLTDAFNRSTARIYSTTHRLTKESDATGNVTFGFDAYGNTTTVTENGSQTTTYAFDAAGRRTLVTDALGKKVHYFYDSEGRLTKMGAGASGTVDTTERFYDAVGVETKIRYTSGVSSYDTFKYYDGDGRLTKQTDWIDGTDGVQYGYAADNRLTRITDYDGSHLDYSYDSLGRVTAMNDYHGNTVSYAYGAAGTLSTITAPGNKVWTYHYDAINQLTSVSLPNGMTAAYLHDGNGRRTAIQYKDGGTVLQGFTLAFAGPDLITKQSHNNGSHWSYFHDGRDRLTKAERYDTDGTTLLHRYSYTLDNNGNVLTKAVYEPGVGTDTTTFAYNAANEQTTMTDGGGTTTFAYDAWGQMTSKDDGTYSATYAYRYEGKLHAVTTDFPGEADVTYEYGGDGKRRSRISGVEETWYNWDREWNVVSEEDDADGSSGDLARAYVNGGDTMQQVESTLADVEGDDPSTGDYHYYALDHIGSVRGLFDQAKSSVATAEYDSYGAAYAASGAPMPQAFTGKPYDGASGLYYFPYRMHSAQQMRWIVRDPEEMIDGLNMYAYASGSPINTFDRMGLFGQCSTGEVKTCGSRDNDWFVPQQFYWFFRSANFRHCCFRHDQNYFCPATSYNTYTTRLAADVKMRDCQFSSCNLTFPWWDPGRYLCAGVSVAMHLVVRALGESSFLTTDGRTTYTDLPVCKHSQYCSDFVRNPGSGYNIG